MSPLHKTFNIFKKELINILKDRLLIVAVIIIIGFTAYGLLDTTSGNDMTLVNLKRTSLTTSLSSANMAAILGAAMFAIVTCFTISRDKRKKSCSLIDSSINSIKVFLIRVAALLIYALITMLLILIVSFILQTLVLKESFHINIFFFSYTVVTLMAMIFSILLCSSIYLIAESLDIVFLAFGFLFFTAISSEKYLFNWINFPYSIYSDFAGTQPIGKLIVYSRLFQCSIFFAVFMFGFLFKRKYEFSALKSFFLNVKSVKITPILICFFIGSAFLYINEPYTEKMEITSKKFMEDYKTNKNITLVETKPHTFINTNKQIINCDVIYIFDKKEEEEYIDFIRNTGLKVSSLLVNGQNVPYVLENKGEVIRVPVSKGKKAEIRIKYEGEIKNPTPSGFAGYICKDSVYLLENSSWIFNPLTNIDKNMKIKGSVEAPKNLTVATIGKLESTSENISNKLWEYTAQSSEFDIGIFAGEYKVMKFKSGNAQVELYYSPKHEKYIENAKIKERITEMIAYYEKNFGEYAFKDYPFKVVETSQYKSGGHSTHNVVTVAEYMFNRDDTPIDTSHLSNSSYVYYHDMEILAHEVSHQWWGGGINISESNSKITEGLANYSSYLYMKNSFKDSERNIINLWQSSLNNPNKEYFKDEKIKQKLSKDVQMKMGITDIVANSYNKIPLELIRINEEGKCDVERNLKKIYNNYKGTSLNYDKFLEEMGLTRGELKID